MLCIALLAAAGTLAYSAGQAVHIDHPVLEHDIDQDSPQKYKKRCERLMSMGVEEMLSFVPKKPVCRFAHCLNCHGGSSGSNVYSWDIENPDQVTCKYCGMVFPNEKYPMDKIMEGKNAPGETFTYRYHQDKEQSNLRIFIPAHILMHKRNWSIEQLGNLAAAYHVTGKEEYAHRGALILDRIAQVYPHYPVMDQNITLFRFHSTQEPPYPWAGGRWERWMPDEIPWDLIPAYDLLYDSSQFDRLSEEREYDVREKIEEDFLKATWEYVSTFDDHTHNMAPYYHARAIRMGRVIQQPEYVHWSYRWLVEILRGGFHYDGC